MKGGREKANATDCPRPAMQRTQKWRGCGGGARAGGPGACDDSSGRCRRAEAASSSLSTGTCRGTRRVRLVRGEGRGVSD